MGEVEEIQKLAVEDKLNPHAAIIARHAARKSERERIEREEQERLEEQEKAKEMQLKRKETVKAQKEQVQQRHQELLAVKPLEPIGGDFQRFEGSLKGWKNRYVYLEDKLPLQLKIYKHFRVESELIETLELTSDAVLEEEGNVLWGTATTRGASPGGDGLARESSSGTISSLSSLKKAKAKQQYLQISVKDKLQDKTIKLATESPELRAKWVEYLVQVLDKHHGLVRSIVPDPPAPAPSASPKALRKSMSFEASKIDPKKRNKSSISISEEECVINPLEDEVLGQSFKNELFGL